MLQYCFWVVMPVQYREHHQRWLSCLLTPNVSWFVSYRSPLRPVPTRICWGHKTAKPNVKCVCRRREDVCFRNAALLYLCDKLDGIACTVAGWGVVGCGSNHGELSCVYFLHLYSAENLQMVDVKQMLMYFLHWLPCWWQSACCDFRNVPIAEWENESYWYFSRSLHPSISTIEPDVYICTRGITMFELCHCRYHGVLALSHKLCGLPHWLFTLHAAWSIGTSISHLRTFSTPNLCMSCFQPFESAEVDRVLKSATLTSNDSCGHWCF